jgi:hypothetical protein
MCWTKLKMATPVLLGVALIATGAGLVAFPSAAGEPRATAAAPGVLSNSTKSEAPNAEVQKVLNKFRLARPSDNDLAIFRLDWTPTLKAAKAKAAKEQRPIFLIVVTNSFGDMHSGHC